MKMQALTSRAAMYRPATCTHHGHRAIRAPAAAMRLHTAAFNPCGFRASGSATVSGSSTWLTDAASVGGRRRSSSSPSASIFWSLAMIWSRRSSRT